MNDVPILDRAKLDKLVEWGGPDLRSKLIDLFFENAPERLAGIRTGLAEGDMELAERSAHSLKSSAGNLGAESLQALAGQAESMLESGEADGVEALMPQLEERLSQTLQALREEEGGKSE